MNWPKLLQSSANSENLSLTVKAVTAFILLTVGGQEASGLTDQVSNAIVTIIVAAGQVVSAGAVLWGLIRKWRNAGKPAK